MESILYILFGLVVGTVLGWLIGSRKLQESLATARVDLSASKQAHAAAESAKLSVERALEDQRSQAAQTAGGLRDELRQAESNSANAKYSFKVQEALSVSLTSARDKANDSVEKLQGELNDVKQTNSGLTEKLKSVEERLTAERKSLETLQETFKKEFEAISNKLLLNSSTHFTKQSSESLENLLKPLKTNIDEFKAKLEAAHTDATAQSALLKEQIKNIGTEAANLSKALKGDAKTLGNWGENMLDLILEKSGLQWDVHYRRQQGVSDGSDQRFLDVIIDLPDKKHLIIDSKVSLKHYEAHVNCADDAQRESHLDDHVGCIETHIRGLSAKR